MKLFTLAALIASAALLHATAPLPNSSYLGINKSVQVNSQLGYSPDGGGEFAGTVNGYSTAFWCIDDQLYFQWHDSGLADIISLGQVAANPSEVRYGDVTNAGNPHWTNTPASSGLALPDTAAERFEMAAWLVSQYAGFDGQVNGGADQAQNTAIQQAIWAITNNSTSYAQNTAAYHTITADTGPTSDGYWINQALAHYTSINTQHWAVVSWGAAADGTLYTGNYNSTYPAHQTFLVEVTPEPAYWGALAVGLLGLFLARRRKAAL